MSFAIRKCVSEILLSWSVFEKMLVKVLPNNFYNLLRTLKFTVHKWFFLYCFFLYLLTIIINKILHHLLRYQWLLQLFEELLQHTRQLHRFILILVQRRQLILPHLLFNLVYLTFIPRLSINSHRFYILLHETGHSTHKFRYILLGYITQSLQATSKNTACKTSRRKKCFSCKWWTKHRHSVVLRVWVIHYCDIILSLNFGVAISFAYIRLSYRP